MKVVNICLTGSYNLGWGYQDNLLSKYQNKNGNEVTLITTQFINDKNSEEYLETDCGVFNDNGVKVIRLRNGFNTTMTKILRHYKGLYEILKEEKPDFIFIHGLQFLDIFYVCKYLNKNPKVRCSVDGHADYSNSAQSFAAKVLHKTIWKYCAKKISKYATTFYGVLPLRCDFLHEMYHIPSEKIKLLIMGADDELLNEGANAREKTRKELGISSDDLLIITGGKIDYHKQETLVLMDAINHRNDNMKLAIFGSVANEMQSEFNKKMSDKIINLGWLSQNDIYKYICASDFGFFPGRHSVIWEQMVAAGIPCAFKDIENTHHVDIGGNCIFLKGSSEIAIKETLDYISDKDNYEKMLKAANNYKKDDFLYSEIAKKSLE